MQWLKELRLHLGNICLGLRGRAQINLKRQGLPTQTRKIWHHWIWPLRRKRNCSQKRSMFIALNSFNIWFKCKLVYASSQGLTFQDLFFLNCWQPSPAKSIKQILRCQGGFRAATTRTTRPGVQEKGRKTGSFTWPSPGKPACWLPCLLAGFSASP